MISEYDLTKGKVVVLVFVWFEIIMLLSYLDVFVTVVHGAWV